MEKAPTKPHAKAGALMEAIERYSSLSSTHRGTFIQGSYSHLSKSYNNILHPAEVTEPVNQQYDDESTIMDFLLGFDLLTGESILIPAEIALYRYSPNYPAVSVFHIFIRMDLHPVTYWRKQYAMPCAKLSKEMR